MRQLDFSDLPEALRPVTDFLAKSTDVVRASSNWCEWRHDVYSLELTVTLVPVAEQIFPAQSVWHLVLSAHQYPSGIHIHPDRELGLKSTFPHQEAVYGEKGNEPWSNGHPCLGEPTDAWGERYGLGNEPADLAMRLIWQVERFAGWCRRASEGRLHNQGDHFELPPLPNGAAATVIGFSETERSFDFWLDTPQQSGVATLVEISTPLRGLAIQSWQTTENQILASSPWGDFIGSAMDSGIPCVWFRLKSLPVLEAWQLPRTYRELRDVLQRENFDLEETFTLVGKSIRKAGIKKPATLLIGFPIPKKFGDPAQRMHWLAIQNIPISKKDRIRQGFRGTEENRQRFDQELARSTQKLEWAKCENWAPDQIRTRLRNRNQERPSILLIGAGALGSQVAETLVRMGVSEIGIQDMDLLAAGNLCRHSLDLTSIGQGKTAALVRRLNQSQPDVRAKAYKCAFPEIGPEGVIVPDSYDIIVDCTGENSVLRGLSFSPWKTEKLFISLSMTWGAQGLLVWASRGSAFPAIDAIDRLGVLAGSSRPDDLDEVIEGIGCWHPVFPADAADVQVWAGIGSRFILDMAQRHDDHCGTYYFNHDGTIGHRYG